MDSKKIQLILVLVLATFASLYLGVSAATAQLETVVWVVGGIGLSTCLLLGRRIWMILPFMFSLNLILSIPTQPGTALLAQVVFVGFCVLLFLMRKLPFRVEFTELEFWMLLVSLSILQVYLRNPVGLNIFGGASVGGKPYVLYAITLACSVFLATMIIPAADLKWILRLSILGGLLNIAMLTFGSFLPSVGRWYGANSIASSTGTQQGGYGAERAGRISFVRDFARNLSLWIGSFKSPIRACFHPVWAPLVLLSLALAAFSGFRSEIAAVGLTYLVAIAYRNGKIGVVVSSLLLVTGIVCLAFVNLVAPLPLNIQRALSFLPGTWNEAMVEDTESSTDWRVEMWKEALFTDFWIQNKAFGDGLGMTREEINYIMGMKENQKGVGMGSGRLTLDQESMIAAGNFHSGPVSTIRTIGYFGLIVLLLAQIRLAVHAHRQILRTRNTEWFPLALLIGIPLIWSPVYFAFVFGTFGEGTTSFLLGAAMIRVLENNLPLPAYVVRKREPFVLMNHRSRSAQQ